MTGTVRVNNGMLECEMAAAGLGLAMVPTFYAVPYLRTGRLKRVLERYRMAELGIHARAQPVPPKVRAFVDFLAARFGRKSEATHYAAMIVAWPKSRNSRLQQHT